MGQGGGNQGETLLLNAYVVSIRTKYTKGKQREESRSVSPACAPRVYLEGGHESVSAMARTLALRGAHAAGFVLVKSIL